MITLNIELPEDLTSELKNRHISDEMVHVFVVQAIHAWLRSESSSTISVPDQAKGKVSPFAESSIPYIDKLIDENRVLFERLAKLPDDD